MRYVESFQSLLPIILRPSTTHQASRSSVAFRSTAADVDASSSSSSSYLVIPKERDDHYSGNTAQYLIDLHDNKATLNFCGGMMFQFVLSEKLLDHLEGVAATSTATSSTGDEEEEQKQPVVFDSSNPRMHQIPNYQKTSNVDNIQMFHGREIRQVPDATGGMNFVLQLSYSDNDNNNNDNNNECDPEGWTVEEKERYDGWGHDSGREWRKGDQLVKEGYTNFQNRFGGKAYSLHHRFYFHYDKQNRLWLSAEDGCEGFPDYNTSTSKSGIVNSVVNGISSFMNL